MTLVTRQGMADDSGVFTDGTVVNKAFFDQIYGQIDDQCHSTTSVTTQALKPKAITDEVVAARGNRASLDARISGVISPDGNFLLSSAEVGSTLSDNTPQTVFTLKRTRFDATPPGAADFGADVAYKLEGFTNNSEVIAVRLRSAWERAQSNDTTDRDSYYAISVMKDNALAEAVRVASDKSLQLQGRIVANPAQTYDFGFSTLSTMLWLDAGGVAGNNTSSIGSWNPPAGTRQVNSAHITGALSGTHANPNLAQLYGLVLTMDNNDAYTPIDAVNDPARLRGIIGVLRTSGSGSVRGTHLSIEATSDTADGAITGALYTMVPGSVTSSCVGVSITSGRVGSGLSGAGKTKGIQLTTAASQDFNTGFDATGATFISAAISLASGGKHGKILWSGGAFVTSASGASVGVNTESPESSLVVVAPAATVNYCIVRSHSIDTQDKGLIFRGSRGIESAKTAAAITDTIGNIYWQGWDGSNYSTGAQIAGLIDTAVGANDVRASLVFSTKNASSLAERWRFKSDGMFVPGAANTYDVGSTTLGLRASYHGDSFGGYSVIGSAHEQLTLSTVGTTTDTSANLLPADAIILSVNTRVTTTITGAGVTSISTGDATTANRFINADTGLAANSTARGTRQWNTSINAALAGPVQAAAAKVRITANGGTPTGGVVRIVVFYMQASAPTS